MILGSRGSVLALRQAQWVRDEITARHRDWDVGIKKIRTTGDRMKNSTVALAGGKGVFVKEIETELLEGRVDLGVHSLKDVPAELPPGLMIGAVTGKVGSQDALITRDGVSLDGLLPGARVGTGSPRRRAQLLRYRRDLEVVPMRGNLDTRLKKLDRGEVDAIVVASAGLRRIGWEGRTAQLIPYDIMLPAPGQGALAIEVRGEDRAARELASELDDPDARTAAEAERAFLVALGGGCRLPAGCMAVTSGETLSIRAAILSPDGAECVQDEASGLGTEAVSLGKRLGERLLEKGGKKLLADAGFEVKGEGE